MRLSTASTALSTVSLSFATAFAAYSGKAPSDSCRPDFRDIGMSIVSHGIEWDTKLGRRPNSGTPIVNTQHRGMLLDANFMIVADADSDNLVIQDIGASQLFVTARDDELILLDRDTCNDAQLWSIRCDTCYSNMRVDQRPRSSAATGCTIINASTGDCVETNSVIGDPWKLAPCNGSERQTFEFRPPTRRSA